MTTRDEVSERIRADLAVVVTDVVATIGRQVPAYADLSADQRREVEAIAGWAIERVLDLWVSGEDLSPADVRRFQGIGAARALDGRPLPGVLRAYRVGATRMTDLVGEAGAEILSAADALALARLWMGALDLLSEAMYAGHSRAATRLSEDRESALADLLTDIVSGRQSVRTALADRCRELGVRLPLRPVVLVRVGGTAPAGAVLSTSTGGIGTDLLDAVPVDPGGRACAVVTDGLADVGRAHRLADLVVREAPGHAFGSRLLDEGDAQALALVRGHRDADPLRLAPGVLGAALGDEPVLVALDAHLRTGSATLAAESLGLHAQTVRHRLRRLRAASGRRPGDPWERFTLAAARW